jgi:hypothetical protein
MLTHQNLEARVGIGRMSASVLAAGEVRIDPTLLQQRPKLLRKRPRAVLFLLLVKVGDESKSVWPTEKQP